MTAEKRNDNHNIYIQGSAESSTIVSGDGNTVYYANVFDPIYFGEPALSTSQSLSRSQYRWRKALITKVRQYWIRGLLNDSLHNQVLLDLGLEERREAVASPVGDVERFLKNTDQTYPEGTQVIEIFDDLGSGRTLLILGTPGAGKTTVLLQVAQSIISRIGDDLSQPIPVVLNLASWAIKRQSIKEWLVKELSEKYHIRPKIATGWIAEEQLILCLDGLDEVACSFRDDCVIALNQFIQTHGRTELIVCSRVQDYKALSEKLKLLSAVCVQPLNSKQIDCYLEQAGEQLAALRTAFERNSEVKELASSPLILSVMSLVYKDVYVDNLYQDDDPQNYLSQLFDAYIETMFRHRRNVSLYRQSQTKSWLRWIAQQMKRESQTEFLIEQIQPKWLENNARRLQYRLESGLAYGIAVGIAVEIISNLTMGQSPELSWGLSFGLISGLIVAVRKDIRPVETITLSFQEIRRTLPDGIAFGLSSGLIIGLILGISAGSTSGLVAGLSIGITGGLALGILSGLLNGLRGPQMALRTKPNHGIWKSAQNGSLIALSAGVCAFLLSNILVMSSSSSVLSNVLIFGLVGGLTGGVTACIRHVSLRFMLFRIGYAPWNYARFLDYAAERLFLQKVGGGYVFIHRMLLEHFTHLKVESVSNDREMDKQ